MLIAGYPCNIPEAGRESRKGVWRYGSICRSAPSELGVFSIKSVSRFETEVFGCEIHICAHFTGGSHGVGLLCLLLLNPTEAVKMLYNTSILPKSGGECASQSGTEADTLPSWSLCSVYDLGYSVGSPRECVHA